MAGEAVVEAMEREGAAGGDEPSLAVLALLVDGGEHRHTGKEQAFLLGLIDRFAGGFGQHRILPRRIRLARRRR